jgi:hypothetical protein
MAIPKNIINLWSGICQRVQKLMTFIEEPVPWKRNREMSPDDGGSKHL